MRVWTAGDGILSALFAPHLLNPVIRLPAQLALLLLHLSRLPERNTGQDALFRAPRDGNDACPSLTRTHLRMLLHDFASAVLLPLPNLLLSFLHRLAQPLPPRCTENVREIERLEYIKGDTAHKRRLESRNPSPTCTSSLRHAQPCPPPNTPSRAALTMREASCSAERSAWTADISSQRRRAPPLPEGLDTMAAAGVGRRGGAHEVRAGGEPGQAATDCP